MPELPEPSSPHAAVIGLGMIGGSIASGLKARGWRVSGSDLDLDTVKDALHLGMIDDDLVTEADLVFVAVPVSQIPEVARTALASARAVTDTGSVKQSVVTAIEHDRFVGGHPMAGSERAGLGGADAALFEGATWVLTPTARTHDDAYLLVREAVIALGASVVTLDAATHDDAVATISHVPHLAASALMRTAVGHDHDVVLRLAAGGFRDMTRIAAGHPDLWTDILANNAGPVLLGLERLRDRLDEIRDRIEAGDSDAVRTFLAGAADARSELPRRQGRPERLASVAVAIPDRPGALAEVFAALRPAQVNVEDLEITHDLDGHGGTLLLTVAADGAEAARAAFVNVGMRASVMAL